MNNILVKKLITKKLLYIELFGQSILATIYNFFKFFKYPKKKYEKCKIKNI